MNVQSSDNIRRPQAHREVAPKAAVRLAVLAGVIIGLTGSTTPATVINGSFEDPALANGAFQQGAVPGWTTSGNSVYLVNVPTTGLLRVSDQTNLDGENAVLLWGSTIRQTVETVAANTQYTVTYRLGDRGDTGYLHPRAEVFYGTTLVMRDIGLTAPVPNDSFTGDISNFLPSLGAGHALLGEDLDLRFGTGNGGGGQAYVDNVSITSNTAPPPMLTNGSFELVQVAGGGYQSLSGLNAALLGWTPSSTGNTYLWHSDAALPGGPSDGEIGVLLIGANTLTQALDVTLVEHGEYSAGFDVARRTDLTSNGGWLYLYAGNPGGGGILLASTSVSAATLDTAPGHFFSASPLEVTTADALALGASLGDSLYLRIAGSGSQTVFDNVSFTFAIPEPSSLMLLTLLVASVFRRVGPGRSRQV